MAGKAAAVFGSSRAHKRERDGKKPPVGPAAKTILLDFV
jgi:hypothetical protein